jgi:two-component system phosphate regulon response regulator PhoB
VRTTVFEYESFERLQAELSEYDGEHDLELSCCTDVRDGEWLLATFKVGEDITSLAGCVIDLDGEVRLSFEERDWLTLRRFAAGNAPPSITPLHDVSKLETVVPPPNCPVLVIDDDADVQQVIQAVLEAKGFETQSVGSAEEAFDLLGATCVKLVIVDWDLPGMSGIEFCRRLRDSDRLRELPVLILTAHPSQSAILEAFNAGADDFVSKPFRSHELGVRILGLLGRGHTEPLRHAIG